MVASEKRASRASLVNKALLIFDLDGTIAESSPLHRRAFNEVFARHGVQVDYEAVAGLTTGVAVQMIAKAASLDLSPEELRALIGEKRRRAGQLIEGELCALEGSIEFIRRVRASHLMSLCTSGSRANAQASLRRLRIEDCFDSVFAAEDVRAGKPAPDLFLRALDYHNVQASKALVFEDSDAGIRGARAAGIDVIRIVVGDPSNESEATWEALNLALAGLG